MTAKAMQRTASGRAGRKASGAAATYPCDDCCTEKINYIQGRSCSTGELADVYMNVADVPDGQCRAASLDDECYEFRWDGPGESELPEGADLLAATGFACCDCNADGRGQQCVFAHNRAAPTYGEHSDVLTCCCGRGEGDEVQTESQDCRWRITAYSFDQDIHSTVFPFTRTHDIYTLTAGVPTAWINIGKTQSISVRRARSFDGGAVTNTDTNRDFVLPCGGYPANGGTPDGSEFWGWPRGTFGPAGFTYVWASFDLPAGDRLGCNGAGTYTYTGRSTGATSYTDWVVTFSFEVECDDEAMPCAGCDGVGETEGGVEDLMP